MEITSRNYVNGEELGMVYGSIVKSRFFTRDIVAGIRKFLGRELKEYTEMLNQSREIAVKRMTKQAEELGADAIVNVRFMTSEITREASEVFVYGTAIKFKKEGE